MSYDRFSQLLGFIYDTALDPANWSRCLEQLRREFSGNYVSLIVRQGSGQDLGYTVSVAGTADGTPRQVVYPHNPYFAISPFSGLRPEKVATITDILSPDGWRASEYYRQWCEPHGVFHVMAVDVRIEGVGTYGFRVTRGPDDPPFSADDRALYEQLVPHFKRALGLHSSFKQDRQVFSLYQQAMGQLMVGVFILDEMGLVIETNAMARAMVALGDGLAISGNRLGAAYPAESRQLQQLVQKVMVQQRLTRLSLGEAMSVTRPSGRVPWGLVAQAISPNEWTEGKHRPCVALFVRDAEGKAEPPIRLTQQLFRLTPAETALATQLANGLSLDEAAEALDIRRNTARAHLRSIFSKTGVRRQTELVRIFLNSVAVLGSED